MGGGGNSLSGVVATKLWPATAPLDSQLEEVVGGTRTKAGNGRFTTPPNQETAEVGRGFVGNGRFVGWGILVVEAKNGRLNSTKENYLPQRTQREEKTLRSLRPLR